MRLDAARPPLGVLVININHFKQFGDRLGHDIGDRLLVQTARYLQREVRVEDPVIRTGGDEYVVLLPDLDEAGTRDVAERLQRTEADGAPVSFTLGWAVRRSPETVEETMRRADQALIRVRVARQSPPRPEKGPGPFFARTGRAQKGGLSSAPPCVTSCATLRPAPGLVPGAAVRVVTSPYQPAIPRPVTAADPLGGPPTPTLEPADGVQYPSRPACRSCCCLSLLPHLPGPLEIKTVAGVTANDIAHDKVGGKLYASVASTSSTYASCIIEIDVSTATVVRSLSVGGDPGALALSDNGQFLLCGFENAEEIARKSGLPALTVGLPLSVAGGDTAAERSQGHRQVVREPRDCRRGTG